MAAVETTIIAGIFTIFGTFIGFFAQLFFRKEKFKEVFYKEKLSAVEQISYAFWNFYKTAFYCMAESKDVSELNREFDNVLDVVSRKGMFISEALSKEASKFTLYTKLWFIPATDGGKEESIIDVKIAGLMEDYGNTLKVLRKELQSDFLTRSINETLCFPFEAFMKINRVGVDNTIYVKDNNKYNKRNYDY